jgi:hypothetical protein
VPPQPRLAIDLSGGMIRILVGSPGGPMRSAEAAAPPDSVRGGSVEDGAAVAKVVRQLLARTEAKETRAMIAASDSLASFRVLSVAKDASAQKVDAAVQMQLPMDRGRMGVLRQDMGANDGERTVYAVAYDRSRVQGLAATARLAGLEPSVVELKSLCVARAAPVPTCVILDLTAEQAEVFLIDANIPRLWHSFKVNLEAGDTVAGEVAAGLRTVLTFYKRQPGGTGFGNDAPVLVSGEHPLPSQTVEIIESLVGHPVQALPPPPRVSPEIRHGAYLACLGLIMRRR